MPVARVRGVIDEKGDDWAIVTVGGVGLLVSIPGTAADALDIGAVASLFTHLHVREDALTLFGFLTSDDLVLFEQLISVSGVGPRVALGLLSALDYGELTTAIAAGHADRLRKVPGIGQKTAERLVLELRDKVHPPAAVASPARPAPSRSADAEVAAALMGLGYSAAESEAAASQLPKDAGSALEDRIRLALSYFAKA
jgi:Holliday junction DNA helicase RuvA